MRQVLAAVVSRNPFGECGLVWCAECSKGTVSETSLITFHTAEGIGAQALKRRLSSPSVDEMEAKRRRSRPYANIDPMVSGEVVGG